MKISLHIFLCLIFALSAPGCAKKVITPITQPIIETEIDILSPSPRNKSLVDYGIESAYAPKEEPSKILEEVLVPQGDIQEISEQDELNLQALTLLESLQPEQDPSIEFYFENADLEQLVNQIADIFNITFISDDSISPMPAGAKAVRGNKISFKTNRPLTKTQAWNLFISFMELAGFGVVAQPDPLFMRITSFDTARKSPAPTYIGVPYTSLPDNDQIIRYVYFIENSSPDTIKTILDSLKSTTSIATILPELRALVMTDKSYNIKSLMAIIKELDQVTMPQAMSVLRLKKADALDVKKLYDALMTNEDRNQPRMFNPRKPSTSAYFPENTKIIPEPRTNSLILLGPADAIKKIEEFIITSVDVDLSQPYSPLHIIQLQYADAVNVANIMNEVTQFGKDTPAGRAGGVRGGDKYLKPITFTAEPSTNRLVVKGDFEDFLRAKEIVTQLDAPQPQVGIEVLLLSVSLTDTKQLGSILRSREPGFEGLFGDNVKFQTSGLFGGTSTIQENPDGAGVRRLLGNLLEVVVGAPAGNTIVSLGDQLSTWGIIQALETISNTQVLSNPYVIATNKTQATVSLGEIRRVVTGTVIGTQDTQTFGDAPALLKVLITPQINSDGMILLDLNISLSEFLPGSGDVNAARTERAIVTKAIVADKEVLALGGLINDATDSNVSKVPILGDIPIIGWLFKNKSKQRRKSNLLVLITVRIIEPMNRQAFTDFTKDHIIEYNNTVDAMQEVSNRRDPIHRWFFDTRWGTVEKAADKFIYQDEYADLRPRYLFEGPNKATIDGNPPVAAPVVRRDQKAADAAIKAAQCKPKSSRECASLTAMVDSTQTKVIR